MSPFILIPLLSITGLVWFPPTEPRLHVIFIIKKKQGFPDGAVVESLPADAGDTGSSPGLGRSHMPRSD